MARDNFSKLLAMTPAASPVSYALNSKRCLPLVLGPGADAGDVQIGIAACRQGLESNLESAGEGRRARGVERQGADSMEGGAGNDTYIADDAGDTLLELADGGYDRVMALFNWTLGAELERLSLSGAADLNGTGNAQKWGEEAAAKLTGKPVELDALVTVVRELGQRTGVATPFTDALLGLARVHAQVHGLY